MCKARVTARCLGEGFQSPFGLESWHNPRDLLAVAHPDSMCLVPHGKRCSSAQCANHARQLYAD